MIIKPERPSPFRSKIVSHIDKYVQNNVYSQNIEKSIYNFTILKATKKNYEKMG